MKKQMKSALALGAISLALVCSIAPSALTNVQSSISTDDYIPNKEAERNLPIAGVSKMISESLYPIKASAQEEPKYITGSSFEEAQENVQETIAQNPDENTNTTSQESPEVQETQVDLTPDRTYKKQYSTEELDQFISAICAENGVDKNLILAMIETESDFNVWVVSSANCQGLMQLSPKYYSSPHGLFDAKENIELGVKTMAELLSKYDTEKALVCYNMGEGGANKSGISSSSYSRKIVGLIDEYKNGKEWSVKY